jgi:hypothetical protein
MDCPYQDAQLRDAAPEALIAPAHAGLTSWLAVLKALRMAY